MRLGLVIYDDLDFPSGGFLYDRKLVEHLRSHGHDVELISFPWRSYLMHLLDNLSASLLRRLEALKIDVLLQDELTHPSLFVLNNRLKKMVSYPLISIVHHLRISENHPIPLNKLYASTESSYLRSVDGFIFNSRASKDSVERVLGAKKPHVVAQPAGDRLTPNIDLEEIDTRSVRPGALRLIFVGNVIRRKGIHFILEAIARLEPGSVELAVLGKRDIEPSYVAHLKRRAKVLGVADQVKFHGYVGDRDLGAMLRRSHLLVLPSIYEGYGIAYVEAMGFGLPVVGSLAGGAGEIITSGEDGFLIDVGDVDELAAIFQKLHQNRALLAQMGRQARKRYERHPTWAQSMVKVEEFLTTYIMENTANLPNGG